MSAHRKIRRIWNSGEALALRFRKKYGSDMNGGPNVNPFFIGVFDTVASLGQLPCRGPRCWWLPCSARARELRAVIFSICVLADLCCSHRDIHHRRRRLVLI